VDRRDPSWTGAIAARDESNGLIDAVTDEKILSAYHLLARKEGVFVEPASATSVAGLLATTADGRLPKDSLVVCTVTGHGLKDPDTVLAEMAPVEPIPVEPHAVAAALELA
jgi:threonine synthase